MQGRIEAVGSTGSVRTDARHARMQMLYRANPPDRNPFERFDKGFAQGKYKKAETVFCRAVRAACRAWAVLTRAAEPHPRVQDANVFQNFDKGFRQPKYRSLEQQASEENPFEKTPSNYPFDETEGGHVWKHWDGDSPMDALHEFNALDTGEKCAVQHAVQRAQHAPRARARHQQSERWHPPQRCVMQPRSAPCSR